jgi:hypothetical protein
VHSVACGSLKLFNRFKLTVTGRGLLVNTSLLSSLWYLAPVCTVPDGDLQRIFNNLVTDFVYADSPGCIYTAREKCSYARELGGLGIKHPVRQVRALRVSLLQRMLQSEPGPWAQLLWALLCQCAQNTAASRTGLLAADDVFGFPYGEIHDDSTCLALKILKSLCAIQPANLPQISANAPLPSAAMFSAVTVCGGVPFLKCTTAQRYDFLSAHSVLVPQQLDEPAVSESTWKERWLWLKKTNLPNVVRQTLWRKWHGKLYLGANRENRVPVCPHCPHVLQTVRHLTFECPVAQSVARGVDTWWFHWTGDHGLPSAWVREWHSNPAWMALFAFVVHSLYVTAVRVAKGTLPGALAVRVTLDNVQLRLSGHLESLARYPVGEAAPRPYWDLGGAWIVRVGGLLTPVITFV